MASKVYAFDEETHTHTIGGVVVPGITTLIEFGGLSDFSNVPAHILEASRLYGTAVHKTIELDCFDALDTEHLDPTLHHPLNEFHRWLKDYGFNKSDFIVETPMGDPALMVACIPDLILDGKLIVEIKSRKFSMLTDSIQTVCQEHVWKKNGGIRTKEYERRVLSLCPGEPYIYQKVNHKQAMSRFRLLLDHFWNYQTIQSWRNT